MKQIAQNKNNSGDNSLNMHANSKARTKSDQREFPFGRTGMIGDYANLEKLNGNFDLLDAMDMQVNGWTEMAIDAHDWTTWPAWMVREIGHTDNRVLLDHFECDCGSCEPTYSEMRDEVYCSACGLLAGQGEVVSEMDEDELYDWSYSGERWKEHLPEELEEPETHRPTVTYSESVSPEWPQKQRHFDSGRIHILWVYSNEEITTEDPITGETITETVKVQLKVAKEDDSWEAFNPVTGELDIPDGTSYLGRDQLVVAGERAAKAREYFETHNETCMVGKNHGHPDNCRECRRLFNRMMKKGAALKSTRDRLTLQV